jgi:hypothetical protein
MYPYFTPKKEIPIMIWPIFWYMGEIAAKKIAVAFYLAS